MPRTPLNDFLHRRPLVVLAPPFVLGTRHAEAICEGPGLTVLASSAVLVTVLCLAWLGMRHGSGAAVLLCLVVSLGGLLAGCLRGGIVEAPLAGHLNAWKARGALGLLCERPVLVRGRLVGLPETRRGMRDDFLSFDVELESVHTGRVNLPLRGHVRLNSDVEGMPVLNDVSELECWVRFRRFVPPANPGAKSRRGGPVLYGRVTTPRLFRVLDHDASWLDSLRRHVATSLAGAMDGRQGKGFARALVLGARDGLEPEFVEGLRRGGVAHVLAVSGLHLALVTGLVASFAGWMGLRRRGVAVACCATALCFAALAGFGVPVVRASILVAVVSAGSLLGRRSDKFNALAAAAIGAAWYRPSDALSLGFVLTFGAAAALVALRPALLGLLPEAQRLSTFWLQEGLAASCAVWLALAPVTLNGFHRLNLMAPLVNLAAVPLAAVATGASLVTALVSLASTSLAKGPALVVSASAALLDALGQPAAQGELRLPEPSAHHVGLYLLGLLAFAALRDPRLRMLGVLLVTFGLHAFMHPDERVSETSEHASLTMLDVGQGSATLVTIPDPSGLPWHALIDAGGRPNSEYDVGEGIVAPALWALGISELDALILSHADEDHVGGMPSIVRLFRPREVLVGPQPTESIGSLRELFGAVRETGVRLRRIQQGDTIGPEGAGARLNVLWPAGARRASQSASRNDMSLVLRLELSRRDGHGPDSRPLGLALVPGDLTAAGEGQLLGSPPPSAAILILGHHGSRTSSSAAFLTEVRPRVALVSAGRRNRFGHPHPVVTERMEGLGIPLLTTASEGAVQVGFLAVGRGAVALVLPERASPSVLSIRPFSG